MSCSSDNLLHGPYDSTDYVIRDINVFSLQHSGTNQQVFNYQPERPPRLQVWEWPVSVSKMHMITPAMGELSFYLLDQGADGTPPLLGARELRRRHALISYKGDWLAYKQANGWWASALETTPSGHLALDIF